MKEKGGVEPECRDSMKFWGWKVDTVRDGLRCPNCGELIYPDAKPGTFDFEAHVPCWTQRELRHIYVEVKSGETSLAFSRLEDSQATWAEEQAADDEERVDLWMWVCIGRGVGWNDYPRRSYLFPYEMWHQMEADLDRKSIPHGYGLLDPYELEWNAGGIWLLPESHPARKIYGYEVTVNDGS